MKKMTDDSNKSKLIYKNMKQSFKDQLQKERINNKYRTESAEKNVYQSLHVMEQNEK
jgi:hypothetical protein